MPRAIPPGYKVGEAVSSPMHRAALPGACRKGYLNLGDVQKALSEGPCLAPEIHCELEYMLHLAGDSIPSVSPRGFLRAKPKGAH